MAIAKENAAGDEELPLHNERTQATRRDAPVVCPTCGRRAERKMRGQRYCSTRCRDRGRKRSRKAFLGTDTGAPATSHKSPSKNNALQRWKKRSSLFANAPLNILGGGSWRWPDTPQIDRETSATIVRAEIGSLVVSAGETANKRTKN
jgi:hypothetical protein